MNDYIVLNNSEEPIQVFNFENRGKYYHIGSFINTDAAIISEKYKVGNHTLDIQDNVIVGIDSSHPRQHDQTLSEFINAIPNYNEFRGDVIECVHYFQNDVLNAATELFERDSYPEEIEILDPVYKILGMRRSLSVSRRVPSPLFLLLPTVPYYDFVATEYVEQINQQNVLIGISDLFLTDIKSYLDTFFNLTLEAMRSSGKTDILENWEPWITLIRPWCERVQTCLDHLNQKIIPALEKNCIV